LIRLAGNSPAILEEHQPPRHFSRSASRRSASTKSFGTTSKPSSSLTRTSQASGSFTGPCETGRQSLWGRSSNSSSLGCYRSFSGASEARNGLSACGAHGSGRSLTGKLLGGPAVGVLASFAEACHLRERPKPTRLLLLMRRGRRSFIAGNAAVYVLFFDGITKQIIAATKPVGIAATEAVMVTLVDQAATGFL
jgi:hypothetical protein